MMLSAMYIPQTDTPNGANFGEQLAFLKVNWCCMPDSSSGGYGITGSRGGQKGLTNPARSSLPD